jgi:hypothetical protein
VSSVLDLAGRMLFLMMAGHAVADYPLQGRDLSEAKRRPGLGCVQYLLLHGLIHGGFVALVTGRWELGVAETILHASIDWLKARRRINHLTDQALHALCKVLWVLVVLKGLL